MYATLKPLCSAWRWRARLPREKSEKKSNKYSPNSAIALLVVALFTLQLSRFYMAFDVMLICPHHAGMNMDMGMGMEMDIAPSGSAHRGHQMGISHPSTKPAPAAPICRCCCRFSWDGLLTIVTLDVPSDSVKAPVFEGARKAFFTANISHPENDLSPPFQPPRA